VKYEVVFCTKKWERVRDFYCNKVIPKTINKNKLHFDILEHKYYIQDFFRNAECITYQQVRL